MIVRNWLCCISDRSDEGILTHITEWKWSDTHLGMNKISGSHSRYYKDEAIEKGDKYREMKNHLRWLHLTKLKKMLKH